MVSKLSQHIKTVAATENNIQIHCKELIEQMNIVVIGLGYVGLPLAVQLAKHFDVWGLDINASRVEEPMKLTKIGLLHQPCNSAPNLRLAPQPMPILLLFQRL
jgi:hypothetical protein